MTNEDMNWLSKAENCESLYLNSSYKLSNIEPLSKLSKLKTLNLDGTNISSAETLKAMKDQLQYLNINSTKISDKDRLDLMLNDTVSVQEGSSTEKVVHINGLLKADDTVTVEDSDVAEAEVRSTENYPSYNYILLTAKKGQAGKTTKLTVTSNDGTSKEFTVNVTGRKEDAPGFADQSMETTIGKFSEIKFKNMSGAKVNISPKSLDKNIVDIKEEEKYDYDKDESITHYYLIPKSEGTTTITVQCKLDGTTYDDTMQISVGTDDQIAPIKDYGLYKAINAKLSNNLQSDHITKDTMSTLKTITANNRSITNLSGIEYATACKKINLSRNKKLKDIDKLKDLNKLENINLSDTAVQDISVLQNIKDQLTYLNLSNSKVPAADRLSFINDKQEISVEAGTKKQVVIKPTGILEAQDECTTEEDDAVKITNEGSGKVEINAENVSEGNVATLIISNSNAADKKITIPINVIAKDKNVPGFAQKSENIEIGNLEKVAFVNEQYTDIDLKSKDTNIIDIEGPYKDEPHFIPKSKGTTTVEATFKKNDGTIYTDSMTVTVKDADASQKITPIKSWETFDRLVQGNDLNLEDGQFKLTEEQMKEVKTISLSFMDGLISEDGLSGLDQAVNCEKFEVGYNGIDYTKIQPLIKKYSNLKSISFQLGYMNQKEFNDLIEANKNLEELKIDLYDSNEDFVEDVSKLKDLTNLKVLHLENVKITDLSGITDLSKLEELKLQYMKITDLSGIEKLTNLKNLDVYDARYIKDFEPISKLKNLESLGLCQTNIKNVDPLRNLEKLKYLNLNGTNVSAKDRLSLIRTKKIELEEGERNESVLLPNGLIESYYGDRVELEQANQGIQLESNGYEIVLKAQRGSVGAKTNLIIKNKDEICAKIPIEVISEKAETVGFKDKEKTIPIGYFGKIDIKNEGDLDEEYWITTSKSSDTEDNEDILNVVERDGAYYYEPIKTGKVTLIGHFTAKDGKRYERNLDVTITNESEGILPISNYKIFTALLDDNGNSVDVNKDYMIDREEIKNVTAFKANYSSVEDKDFDYLTKAVNCKTIDLSDNKALTDLSFINSFKKLKEINLDGDEKISDYTPLVAHKTQFNKIILPAQAPDSVRKDLITPDNISLKEGQTATDVIQPVGLLKDTDTVSVDNNNIAEAKIVPDYDEDEEDIIGEHLEVTGKSKGTTILAIHMGSETKEISITVDAQNTNEKIKFADGSDKVKVAQFKAYNFANVKASNIKDVEFKYGQDDVLKMVQNEDNSYTPIALKDSGKVTVSAKIILKNGLKETVEEKEFTVEPADKEAVIIKDYDLYKGMKNNGKSADVDQNGSISKDEIANVDEIEVINSEIKDLTGAEQAVNCKKVDFSNDAFLKDISALSKLTNLTSLNLRDTAVENIDALKGLTKLDTVNLDDSYVKESDKIALLRLNDMSMTEGETKTQQIIPTGVLGKDIDVSIDSDIAEAKITDGELEVTGKTAGVANLTIGNKGKKETRTIKVTVRKKQEEPKPAPNPTNPGDNKPQTPSQNPTTEAPKPTQPTTATPKKVEKITVTAPSNKVASGKKVKLTANISNDASNKNIKWTTSNKKYATVDKNGVVKFNKKAAGKTVIITAMATDGSGKKATFKIKIMKGSVQKITISGKKSVKAGKTLKLKAKVKAGKGANKKLTWTSSNTNYATVSSSGTVKALKAGKKKSVKITAMATDGSGKKATVTIKIK